MKRKVIYKICPICNLEIGSTAFSRHSKVCKGKKEIVKKDSHGKTQKWYDSMHSRKGVGTNQYTKAAKLGLPKPEISEETREKLRKSSTGRHHTDETKLILSDKAKENYKLGKIKDIGYCIHNGIPSKPESDFIKIIEDFICDKNFIKELPFFKYKLDFSWKHRKICIEIDGEHHNGGYQLESDREKDKLLRLHGWKVLRIKSDDLHNKEKIVDLVNEFINNNQILPYADQWKTKEQLYNEKLVAAKSNGIIDKNGKISSTKLSTSEIESRINTIKTSLVDFNKKGWSKDLAYKLSLHPTYVKRFMKKYMNDFYLTCRKY